MDQFTKSNTDSNVLKKDIELQIIEWWAQDEDIGDDRFEDEEECQHCNKNETYCKCILNEYVIRCFGITKEGQSITCAIKNFRPFYYIKVDNTFNKIKLQRFLTYIESSYSFKNYPNALYKENGKHVSKLVERKDLFGFRNGKEYKFIKLVFTNYEVLKRSRYIFKNPVNIPNITTKATKFKLYESNFEPFMRYCHLKDILMAGWIQLPYGKYKRTNDTSSTQIEVEIDKRDVKSLKEKQSMASFLQASWDIEVYSYDYTFPDPKKQKNEIFQIATTYKYYNDSSILVKHLLTLKDCATIASEDGIPVVVETCKSEKELIKKWVDTISKMDPDIFYTYNGDSFDCMYLVERAKLYGILPYILNNISRLKYTPCVIKKEYFSSSAYGDSEFNRLYIPGRLNYDLLIHYKRGMKKYSSYKLDSISNEILKEGKHDVSAKDIFKFYEKGTPEAIRDIGAYCLQDTELLQKLVDKQLILTNIMQLANVTYVPIGFLTTRGQTIKVYSQLLRKAHQMNFLVPHTNFNEDSFGVFVKIKNDSNIPIFTEESIGEYLTIRLDSSASLNDKDKIINGKISEIIDDNTIIVLSNVELTKEYYNRTVIHGKNKMLATRVWANDDAVDDSFTGATVLEPNPGMYKDNIAILDFASLYPTIMISRNLCYSTFVIDKKYENLPNIKYETIAWEDKVEYKLKHTCEGVGKSGKSKGLVCGKQAFFEVLCDDPKKKYSYFCRIHDPLKKSRESEEKFQKRDVSYNYTIVQPHKDPETGEIVNKGVLPALLEELYSERKRVKKQMAEAQKNGDKLLAEILDSTQLAIKISLNSTYGFLGRVQGNLILKELGSIVTSVGRMLIEQSKEYAEGDFIEYVKNNNLLTYKLKYTKTNLNKYDKLKLLEKFKI
jgi:DNA polymerase elongation subunit (family B)